jgi:hypothetical protein
MLSFIFNVSKGGWGKLSAVFTKERKMIYNEAAAKNAF